MNGVKIAKPISRIVQAASPREIYAEPATANIASMFGGGQILGGRIDAGNVKTAFGDWRLEESTLVVTLEPCAMCMGAIALARVQRVIYGADDPRLGACGSAVDLRQRHIAPHLESVERGVLADECSAILKDFFKAIREGRGVPKQ